MALVYCVGVNPVSKVIAGALTAGATTIAIPNSTGLPTIPSGSCQAARITDPSGTPSEDILFTRSGTTLTLFNSATLANSYSASAAIDFDVISQPAIDQIKQDALSGGPIAANITTTATLVLGKMNYVNLTAASVNLTLPTATIDGQLVGIKMLNTCTKLATIVGTIDGFTNRIMWKNEWAWLSWDAANSMWRKVAGQSLAMIGEIYLAANITPTVDSVNTLITFDTAGIDNTGLMVNTGAHKVTVQRPGNYDVIGHYFISIAAANSNITQGIVKQNSTIVNQAVGYGPVFSYSTLHTDMPIGAVAADDFTMFYNQNSGGTSPTIVGGRGNAYLTVTEVPTW